MSGTAYVGDMKCHWKDQKRTYKWDVGFPDSEYIETVVQCDGYKPIQLGPAGQDHTASVFFGNVGAIYITKEEWERRQEKQREKREYEELNDWGQ